jgi:GNAT superfamily N-acetyltransferase
MEQVSIRAARPDDRERIVTAFRGLERGSVYRRFFFHKKELKEQELRRVTECDGVSAAALVATVGSGDREIIVGLGEYMRSGASADIAFAVEEDFQGRGIASRLLQQLTDIARANGILQFEADVLAENAPMLAVLRNCGLRMQTSAGQGVIHATLFLT